MRKIDNFCPCYTWEKPRTIIATTLPSSHVRIGAQIKRTPRGPLLRRRGEGAFSLFEPNWAHPYKKFNSLLERGKKKEETYSNQRENTQRTLLVSKIAMLAFSGKGGSFYTPTRHTATLPYPSLAFSSKGGVFTHQLGTQLPYPNVAVSVCGSTTAHSSFSAAGSRVSPYHCFARAQMGEGKREA